MQMRGTAGERVGECSPRPSLTAPAFARRNL